MNESVEANERASLAWLWSRVNQPSFPRRKWGAMLVSLAVLLAVSAYAIARSQNDMLDRDFFSFWLAGRMVITGQDPYNEAQWIAGHAAAHTNWLSDTTFLYPLPLAILFAPLGMLPLEGAAGVWAFVTQALLMMSVWLLLSAWKPTDFKTHWLPIVLGVFLFRPVVTMLLHGQLGAIWLLVLSLCIYAWRAEHWRLGGALMPLLALKPSFGLPLVGLLGLWLIMRRQWQALLASALSAASLLIVGWLQDPLWLQKLSTIGNQKLASTFGWAPTLWGIGDAVCQRSTTCAVAMSGGLSVVLVALALIWLRRRRDEADPEIVVGALTAAATLITPYLWTYDQVLLIIPIVTIIHLMRGRKMPYLVTATFFVLIAIFSWLLVIPAFTIGRDIWSVVVPMVCLGLIWMYARRQIRSTQN